jgi:hypothetical protein
LKSNFKILILFSEIRYLIISTVGRGLRLKNQDENTRNEILSKSALIKAKKSHENLEFRIINPLENISREERKKGASKPLYLTRYE